MRAARRTGAVWSLALTAACGSSEGAPPAVQVAVTTTITPAAVTTTITPAAPAEPVPVRVGEVFTLGELRLTVLSVQDPYASGTQLQPAAGHRLVSIRYEAVSLRSGPVQLSDLPDLAVRDAGGGRYPSAHARVSAVNGSASPLAAQPAAPVQTNALVEVPASASGLRAEFGASGRPDQRAVVSLG